MTCDDCQPKISLGRNLFINPDPFEMIKKKHKVIASSHSHDIMYIAILDRFQFSCVLEVLEVGLCRWFNKQIRSHCCSFHVVCSLISRELKKMYVFGFLSR